jgi:hypothetical protein
VRELLGAPVPGGPLDNAAFFQPLDETGQPLPAVLLVIEVKNIRSWIYPRASELHQVLYKAAALKVAHPDLGIVPVLMCRRANVQTFWMAGQLGFQVIQARAQFLPETIEREPVEEVRHGLGYLDLTRSLEAYPPVVEQLTTTIPSVAAARAEQWALSAPPLVGYFDVLRDPALSQADRTQAMDELRQEAEDEPARPRWLVSGASRA